MDLGIEGRVAVVAASSRGLGRAVAEALAAEGVKLALCARTEDVLKDTASRIRDRWKVPVLEQPLDVTDYAAVKKFIAATREQLGAIDICVTNAGGPPLGKFADFSAQDWRRAFELNFMSTLYLIREVLPDMRAQSWGRIVSITSVSVKEPIEMLILSNAIRGAVVGLMKTLSLEYGPDNILFNNLCPGMTATDRFLSGSEKRAQSEGVSPEEIIRQMTETVPLKRVGRPEEFGALAAFLCSEKASYVTGTSTAVDGGLVKGV